MAACLEVSKQAALEEQQDEVTVLQSIFQHDLQLIEKQADQGKICFDLTVQINIPHEKIDFEAFIPIEVEDAFVRRESNGSDSDNDSRTNHQNHEETLDSSEDLSHEIKSGNADQNGFQAEGGPKENSASPDFSKAGTSFGARSKPGFSRSLSLQHWHVRADVRFLTPVHLTCTFPPLYPAESLPDFSLGCLWLSRQQIQELRDKLVALWEEAPGMPIVFTWADWLQNYVYEYLGLQSHLVLKEADNEPVLDTDVERVLNDGNEAGSQKSQQGDRSCTKLQTALLAIFEYDLEMQKQAFRQSTHSCEICFDERDGTEFHYLDECRHFFCNECLKAHCEMHVDSGTVLKLLCPNHECKTQIPPEALQEVLDVERFERWEKLLLSKTLDVMGDIVYCPRCNVAVVVDDDESSRLGHCANCFFAFCTECYEPWHHGQPCFEENKSESDEEESEKSKRRKAKRAKKKGQQNVNDEDSDKEATLLESMRRQRKLQLEKERRNIMSSVSFIQMMKREGKYQFCPKCRMAVERISGCDSMHCSQCQTNFCWRCGRDFSEDNNHFVTCEPIHVQPRRLRSEPSIGKTMLQQYKEQNPAKKLRTKLCPRCHQKCLKENSNNNHLKCWACKADFCYQCGKEIKGTLASHYTAAGSCTQHSED